MGSLMGDIGNFLGVGSADIVQNSTSRKGNTELNMDDFLQLMIVQLTNQTIDDTMDTGEMMNQFLQMQLISTMASMNEISIQSYANSLVGKKVTIGVMHDNVLEERELFVYGTGTYNGQKVVFCEDGNMYFLNQIMAVGILPDQDGKYPQMGGTEDPPKEDPDPNMGIDPENPEDVTPPGGENNNDDTVTGGNGPENPEYGGENGVPTE